MIEKKQKKKQNKKNTCLYDLTSAGVSHIWVCKIFIINHPYHLPSIHLGRKLWSKNFTWNSRKTNHSLSRFTFGHVETDNTILPLSGKNGSRYLQWWCRMENKMVKTSVVQWILRHALNHKINTRKSKRRSTRGFFFITFWFCTIFFLVYGLPPPPHSPTPQSHF